MKDIILLFTCILISTSLAFSQSDTIWPNFGDSKDSMDDHFEVKFTGNIDTLVYVLGEAHRPKKLTISENKNFTTFCFEMCSDPMFYYGFYNLEMDVIPEGNRYSLRLYHLMGPSRKKHNQTGRILFSADLNGGKDFYYRALLQAKSTQRASSLRKFKLVQGHYLPYFNSLDDRIYLEQDSGDPRFKPPVPNGKEMDSLWLRQNNKILAGLTRFMDSTHMTDEWTDQIIWPEAYISSSKNFDLVSFTRQYKQLGKFCCEKLVATTDSMGNLIDCIVARSIFPSKNADGSIDMKKSGILIHSAEGFELRDRYSDPKTRKRIQIGEDGHFIYRQ